MATEMMQLPREAVRELAKWAYAAAYFDGYTTIDHLRETAPDLIDEIERANAEREAADFPRAFADL